MRPESLNGEVWRLDVDEADGPAVLIERSLWDNRYEFATKPEFLALVAPIALRLSLHAALSGGYREIGLDDWRSKWLVFGLQIPPSAELPPADIDDDLLGDWVDDRVAAYSRRKAMRQRFADYLNGGAS